MSMFKVLSQASVAAALTNLAANSHPVSVADATAAGQAVNLGQLTARSVYYIKADFSAVGDGTTDDTTAFRTAVAATPRNGVLRLEPGSYRWSNYVQIARSDLTVEFMPGAIIVQDYVDTNGLFIGGTAPSVFTALSANALKGARYIQVASISGLAADNWVLIRSQALLPDVPNTLANKKCGEWRQITGIETVSAGVYKLHLNGAVLYDYNTADTAEVGVATFRTNIKIINPVFKPASIPPDDSNGTLGKICRQIFAQYAANITIENADCRNTRPLDAPETTPDSASRGVAITYIDVVDSEIRGAELHNIGYYGVAIDGAARNLKIRNVHGTRCRHTVSLVQDGTYGEPVDIWHIDCISDYSVISGFDTHFVGRNIFYRNCISRSAGDDGFQCRTSFVTYEGCLSEYATFDGFSVEASALKTRYVNCVAKYAGRDGLLAKTNDIYCVGFHAANNTGFGITCSGGQILGGRIEDNAVGAIQQGNGAVAVTLAQLYINGVFAPKSATQTKFLCGNGTMTATDLLKCDVKNCGISQYTFAFWVVLGVTNQQAQRPNTGGNVVEEGGPGARTGTATLVAGTATVTTLSCRNYAGSGNSSGNSLGRIKSRISVMRESGASTGLLAVTAVTDRTNFVITSSDAADTSVVAWQIDN